MKIFKTTIHIIKTQYSRVHIHITAKREPNESSTKSNIWAKVTAQRGGARVHLVQPIPTKYSEAYVNREGDLPKLGQPEGVRAREGN